MPCGTAQAAASQGFEQIRNYVIENNFRNLREKVQLMSVSNKVIIQRLKFNYFIVPNMFLTHLSPICVLRLCRY